jgi:hypothetical protein
VLIEYEGKKIMMTNFISWDSLMSTTAQLQFIKMMVGYDGTVICVSLTQ